MSFTTQIYRVTYSANWKFGIAATFFFNLLQLSSCGFRAAWKHASCMSLFFAAMTQLNKWVFWRGTNCLQLLAKAHLTGFLGLTPSSNSKISLTTHRKPCVWKFPYGRVQCVLNVLPQFDYRDLLCVMLETATSRQKQYFPPVKVR